MLGLNPSLFGLNPAFDLSPPQNVEGSSNAANYLPIQTIAGVGEVKFNEATSTLVKVKTSAQAADGCAWCAAECAWCTVECLGGG